MQFQMDALDTDRPPKTPDRAALEIVAIFIMITIGGLMLGYVLAGGLGSFTGVLIGSAISMVVGAVRKALFVKRVRNTQMPSRMQRLRN